MARSLATIQRQIEKLQKEAAAVKAKEVGGVIQRIKTAIAFYGLTPADLFEVKPKAGRVPKAEDSQPARKAKAMKKKSPSVIKYRDELGNSWSGHGKRPGWFKAAIEGGKTAEDLLLKPA